jgi:hypothetical protein
MRRRNFLHVLHRKPFRPFRITVSTGQAFDVLHPETVFVADHFVAVPAERVRRQSDRPDDYVWIDLLHIVHLQPGRRVKR